MIMVWRDQIILSCSRLIAYTLFRLHIGLHQQFYIHDQQKKVFCEYYSVIWTIFLRNICMRIATPVVASDTRIAVVTMA
jgi:hypothetical protein